MIFNFRYLIKISVRDQLQQKCFGARASRSHLVLGWSQARWIAFGSSQLGDKKTSVLCLVQYVQIIVKIRQCRYAQESRGLGDVYKRQLQFTNNLVIFNFRYLIKILVGDQLQQKCFGDFHMVIQELARQRSHIALGWSQAREITFGSSRLGDKKTSVLCLVQYVQIIVKIRQC